MNLKNAVTNAEKTVKAEALNLLKGLTEGDNKAVSLALRRGGVAAFIMTKAETIMPKIAVYEAAATAQTQAHETLAQAVNQDDAKVIASALVTFKSAKRKASTWNKLADAVEKIA